MNRYLAHFKTVATHKWHVLQACRKVGITWRGFTHDLSKFSPIEFTSSARYFNGIRSPIKAEKEALGYSKAWAHHKGHNKHHWEYWTDFHNGELYCVKMPIEDLKELLCDWIGAGKAYNKEKWDEEEAAEYYYLRRNEMHFHKETRILIEEAMERLGLEGERSFYRYVRGMDYE